MKHKICDWLGRYGFAEIFALIGAILGGLIANFFFNNSFLTALSGTWGENVGYYGTIIIKDCKSTYQKHKFSLSIFLKIIRNLVIEFGPAEYLDSFFCPTSNDVYFSDNIKKCGYRYNHR